MGSQTEETKSHTRVIFHPFDGTPHWDVRLNFGILGRIADVITRAKSCDNRLKDFGVSNTRNFAMLHRNSWSPLIVYVAVCSGVELQTERSFCPTFSTRLWAVYSSQWQLRLVVFVDRTESSSQLSSLNDCDTWGSSTAMAIVSDSEKAKEGELTCTELAHTVRVHGDAFDAGEHVRQDGPCGQAPVNTIVCTDHNIAQVYVRYGTTYVRILTYVVLTYTLNVSSGVVSI